MPCTQVCLADMPCIIHLHSYMCVCAVIQRVHTFIHVYTRTMGCMVPDKLTAGYTSHLMSCHWICYNPCFATQTCLSNLMSHCFHIAKLKNVSGEKYCRAKKPLTATHTSTEKGVVTNILKILALPSFAQNKKGTVRLVLFGQQIVPLAPSPI